MQNRATRRPWKLCPPLTERFYPRCSAGRWSPEDRDPTCVASEGSSRNDRLVLVHIGPISNIVLEGALGLVVGQGGGVVLRVKAVVGGDALQALEGGLAAPGLRQAVAAVVALYALKGVLAAQFTWGEGRARERSLANTGMLQLAVAMSGMLHLPAAQAEGSQAAAVTLHLTPNQTQK